GKVRIRGRELPSGAKSAITLTLLWLVFIVSFMTLIPLVAGEFQNLERVSVETVVSSLDSPLHELGVLLEKYGLIDDTTDLKHHLSRSLNSIIDTSKIGVFFGSLAGTVSGILIALFSISFISFFFLKDSGLFKNIVLAILPERYATSAVNALDSIQKLLVRYFVGILIEVLGVMMLNTIGLLILGFNLSNALVIGLISGILNVIPYIGPLIGIIVGILVGIVSNIGLPFYTDMLPLLIYMTMIMLFTQLIDNIVFQPFIYGTSVYAHPLEIFLVILMAGSIAGIPGMILAIPSYTVLRVILREFFSNYRLVKKITQGIER
ncbi:AI-2E family transporter, partial [Odoribacter sp. OttesenSCG-928-G04]|nr:AI-2E family transporter [Odoribacter sp. OttesenSCG-928-G04]